MEIAPHVPQAWDAAWPLGLAAAAARTTRVVWRNRDTVLRFDSFRINSSLNSLVICLKVNPVFPELTLPYSTEFDGMALVYVSQ